MLDGTSRFRKNGQPLHHFLQVSGYATHSVLLEESVIPIRKDAPLDLACLVSCGVLAGAGPVFNRAKVPPGASVAVFGCGGVGLNTIQAARMVGAGKIIAVDVNPQKLKWAEEFGATHVVDASKEDPVARVQALGGIGGVDFAFEVVGTQKTIEQALPRLTGAAPASSWASARPARDCPSTPACSSSSACSRARRSEPATSARMCRCSSTSSWRASISSRNWCRAASR
jgi:S-(hydroxymethyl)glutathione dehydrogenase/alcohol dehydrogenase